jgi:hypothetical protein
MPSLHVLLDLLGTEPHQIAIFVLDVVAFLVHQEALLVYLVHHFLLFLFLFLLMGQKLLLLRLLLL